mgnify:CR=1 FL=1
MFFKRKPHEEKQEKHYEEIKKSMDLPIEPSYEEEFIERKEPVSAPLFVKVEKYQNVLASMNEMRSFVSSMKQLFNVLYELETVRNDSLKIMRATVQRLEKSLMEIDSALLRPKGIELSMPYTEGEVHHMEDSLGELQRQLSDLRRELQELK